MNIQVKGDFVDFEAPIYASDDQRELIKAFFRKHFPSMAFKDVEEPERQYEDRTAKAFHRWKANDYLELFSSKTNEEIAADIGSDTSMGVQVKRGMFIMTFLKWKKTHGKDSPITEKLIQQFLDEVSP